MDHDNVFLVIYNKQKIPQIKYWEGRTDCLGKWGLSMIGVMLVHRVKDKGSKGVLDFIFFLRGGP